MSADLHASALLTAWTIQPIAIVVAALLAVTYRRGVRRLSRPWPRGRVASFGAGLALLLLLTCGPPQVYADSLYWVWTTQTLVLWLAVPVLVLSGHPVQLLRATAAPGGARRIDRVLASRFARVVGNPLVGPALVPLLSGVLFFGPVPGWAIASPVTGWALQLALLVIGGCMVLPLVGLDDGASSLAVGLSLAIGSFELVLDALPGVVLRLKDALTTTWFDHRALHAWSPNALHDQRSAGAILWAVAEIIDLPFLLLVFRRWTRADARDAAAVDAVLEAERAARADLPGDHDAPWWLSDPAMRQRLRRSAD